MYILVHFKLAERRGGNASNAVQSPRTPCGGVYFEHAIDILVHTSVLSIKTDYVYVYVLLCTVS